MKQHRYYEGRPPDMSIISIFSQPHHHQHVVGFQSAAGNFLVVANAALPVRAVKDYIIDGLVWCLTIEKSNTVHQCPLPTLW